MEMNLERQKMEHDRQHKETMQLMINYNQNITTASLHLWKELNALGNDDPCRELLWNKLNNLPDVASFDSIVRLCTLPPGNIHLHEFTPTNLLSVFDRNAKQSVEKTATKLSSDEEDGKDK